jgi:phosphatidylserine/phosphatidylglycerophosphate/cardiolipin synthase-like enzyme
MMWLYIATGATGGMTALFCLYWINLWLSPPPKLEVRFSPKGGCIDMVVRAIESARHEILMMAYSFTADPITNALIAAKKRGVTVDVLMDKSNEAESYSDLHLLLKGGVEPLIDAHHAIAHNKVLMVDGKLLLTGSFNFTNQAEGENAENLLKVTHHREILAAYRKDFASHREHCRKPQLGAAPAEHHRHAA